MDGAAEPVKDLYQVGEIPPLGHVPARMHAWAIRRERHGDPDTAMQVEVGMRMLTLRGIVTETEGVYAAAPDATGLLRFYANSIVHLLPEEPA